ncbi:MAG TPA: TlpA disulfide reductase family protein [Candidatus Binatia bacterium]|nr:TlpA disulfide reductase family protein [Candidatus Binatia bacterium]
MGAPRLVVLLTSLVLVAACSAPVARTGQPAPPLAGATLDGGHLDLAELRGRPVIVNFWASWCVPCREEFPLLAAALRDHAQEGLVIVGVLFKDEPEPARRFVAEQGVDWPTVLDPDGRLAAAYRVVAPPQTYFIDRSGIVRSIQIGELLEVDLDRQLPAILAR